MKCSIFITFLLIISNISFAQENNLRLTLINSDTLFQSYIEELIEDSVKISSLQQSQWIKVDSIIEIRQHKGSKFWAGAGLGLLGGAVLGGLIGDATYEHDPNSFFGDTSAWRAADYALHGGIYGALGGSIVGALLGKDKVYNLSQKKLEQKIEILNFFVVKEK